jgi:hypothetical protein
VVTGVVGYGKVGNATVSGSAVIYLTGVQAQGIIGQVLVWGQIPDVPNPNWTQINDGNNATWTQINDATAENWDLIAA